jgi:hypothetical protein
MPLMEGRRNKEGRRKNITKWKLFKIQFGHKFYIGPAEKVRV